MENSQQLATESFSYSWLVDCKPYTTDGNSCKEKQNFDFDVPIAGSSNSPVHADEIFYNRQIMPVYAVRSSVESLKASTSNPPSPVSLCTLRSPCVAKNSRTSALGKWRKLPKRITQKCFRFMKPLCRRIKWSRKSSRVDDIEKKIFDISSLEASPTPGAAYSYWSDVKKINKQDDHFQGLKEVKAWSILPQASQSLSPSNYSSNGCRDAESSIHEAVLYCKRSMER